MPANVSAAIRAKLEQYALDPDSLANNVKALKGEAQVYRLRVGNWRALFIKDGSTIIVVKFAPRGRAYE